MCIKVNYYSMVIIVYFFEERIIQIDKKMKSICGSCVLFYIFRAAVGLFGGEPGINRGTLTGPTLCSSYGYTTNCDTLCFDTFHREPALTSPPV